MNIENIDIEKLRSDLIDYLRGSFIVTGFGAPLVESVDLEYASDDEVINTAINNGISLIPYYKNEEYNKKI